MTVCTGVVFHSYFQKSQYWPGWYLLRVPSDVDEKKIIETMKKHGINNVRAPSTTTIQYMAIPDMQSITVNQIDNVLVKGDPRRDPFLQNVENLFLSGDSYIIYLPASRSITTYRKIIRKSPILENAVLLDDIRNGNFLVLWLFLFLIGGLGYVLQCNPTAFLTSSLPIGVIVLVSGLTSVFICLSLCSFALCRYVFGRLSAVISVAGSLIVMYTAWVQFPLWVFIVLIIATSGTEILSFGLHRSQDIVPGHEKSTPRLIQPYKKRDHQLFEPVFLTQRSSRPRLSMKWKTTVINNLSVVLILPFAIMVYQSRSHESVPAAYNSTGSYESISALHALNTEHKSDNLPDISDLISSIAYQEGLMNGAQYKLPIPGTKLQKNQYSQEGRKIISQPIPVVNYDVQWYRQTILKAFSQGIGTLYSTHSGPSRVVQAVQPVDAITIPPFLLHILIALMLLCALNFHNFRYEKLLKFGNRFFLIKNINKKTEAA